VSLSELECTLTTKEDRRTYTQLQVGYISVNNITTEERPAGGGLMMMGRGSVEKEEVRLRNILRMEEGFTFEM
jgi:hypothetical protein